MNGVRSPRDLLLEYLQRRDKSADDALVFGQASGAPFPRPLFTAAQMRPGLAAYLTGRLLLHEARHSYASYVIAAVANPKAISTFMGHSSINVTFDLYRHLMPGAAAGVASLLTAYLSHRE